MSRFILGQLGAVLLIGLAVSTAGAQTPPASPAPQPGEPSVAGRFLRDVGGDYKHFFSQDTALLLGLGGGAALAIHPADESIATSAEQANVTLKGGATYGSQLFQVPVAVAWWIAGSAAGSERNAEAGRDLLRAQLAVFSWGYAIKYATDRTRPNGDPRSFPSGHAASSFATAMVLQEHFGWKLGLPAFAMASYTATSRVTGNFHWTSDVVFGAALGMACGHTVTFRRRHMQIAPVAFHRGGAVFVTVLKQP